MKRLTRCLFNGVAAVSLLLCVSFSILWLLSYSATIAINWRNASSTLGLDAYLAYGETDIGYTSLAQPPRSKVEHGFVFHFTRSAPGRDLLSRTAGSPNLRFAVLGFGLYSLDETGVYQRIIFWPCWASVLATALFPIVWYFRRRRFPPGFCESCGYDLRATPERCPECGHHVSTKVQS